MLSQIIIWLLIYSIIYSLEEILYDFNNIIKTKNEEAAQEKTGQKNNKKSCAWMTSPRAERKGNS